MADPDVVTAPLVSAPVGLRWGRIGIAVVFGEIIPIVGLFFIVYLHGLFTADPAPSSDHFARTASSWLGPIVGAIAAFAASNWAGKEAPHVAVRQALIIGAAIAVLDLAILSAIGQGMQPLSVFSNAEKVAAALLGGVCAAIRDNPLSR